MSQRKAKEIQTDEKINTSRGTGDAGDLEFARGRIFEGHHRIITRAQTTLEYGGDLSQDFSGEGFCTNLESEPQ